MNPVDRLRHHVSGAIARGEKEAIVERRMNATEKIRATLAYPSTSYWLKEAIRGTSHRDQVDAFRDATILAALLEEYLNELHGV